MYGLLYILTHSLTSENTTYWGWGKEGTNDIEAHHFESRKRLKMAISG